ncbi:MAG: putative PEP-binding protein [Candidatus Omnitrophota bacterium]
MNKEGQSVAALITGGYHTKGISELLKAKETSYLVILPKFDASRPERPYVAILTNKTEDYSKLLASGRYQILAEDYMKEHIQDAANVEIFIMDVVVASLGQAAIAKKDVEGVKRLWIDAYRNAYENLEKDGLIESKPEIQNPKFETNSKFKIQNSIKTGDQNIAAMTNTPPPGALPVNRFEEIVNALRAVVIAENSLAVFEVKKGIFKTVELKDGDLIVRDSLSGEVAAYGKPQAQKRTPGQAPASTTTLTAALKDEIAAQAVANWNGREDRLEKVIARMASGKGIKTLSDADMAEIKTRVLASRPVEAEPSKTTAAEQLRSYLSGLFESVKVDRENLPIIPDEQIAYCAGLLNATGGYRTDQRFLERVVRVFCDLYAVPDIRAAKIMACRGIDKKELSHIFGFIKNSDTLQEIFNTHPIHRGFFAENFGIKRLLNFPEHTQRMIDGLPVMPLTLEVHPSPACDNKCESCYNAGHLYYDDAVKGFRVLTVAEWEALVNEAADKGLKTLYISGGLEPLHRLVVAKTIAIIKTAKARGMKVILFTHGNLVDTQNQELVDALLRLDEIHLSLKAATPETYTRVVGANTENLQKGLDAVRYLAEEKKGRGLHLKVCINFLVNANNFTEVPALFEFAEEVGADSLGLRSDYIRGLKGFSEESKKELGRTLNRLKTAHKWMGFTLDTRLSLLAYECDKTRIPPVYRYKLQPVKGCQMAYLHPAVNPFGRVFDCCLIANPAIAGAFIPLGRIGTGHSLEDVLAENGGHVHDAAKCMACNPWLFNVISAQAKLKEDYEAGIALDMQPFRVQLNSETIKVAMPAGQITDSTVEQLKQSDSFNRLNGVIGFTGMGPFPQSETANAVMEIHHDTRVGRLARMIADRYGLNEPKAEFIGISHNLTALPFRHFTVSSDEFKALRAETGYVEQEHIVRRLEEEGFKLSQELKRDIENFDRDGSAVPLSDEAKAAFIADKAIGAVEDFMFGLRFGLFTGEEVLAQIMEALKLEDADLARLATEFDDVVIEVATRMLYAENEQLSIDEAVEKVKRLKQLFRGFIKERVFNRSNSPENIQAVSAIVMPRLEAFAKEGMISKTGISEKEAKLLAIDRLSRMTERELQATPSPVPQPQGALTNVSLTGKSVVSIGRQFNRRQLLGYSLCTALLSAAGAVSLAVYSSFGQMKAPPKNLWQPLWKKRKISHTYLDTYYKTLRNLSTGSWKDAGEPYIAPSDMAFIHSLSRFDEHKGAMLGVGLQQNFSLALHVRPSTYIFLDINPAITEVMIPFFGRLMEFADTRREFLSMLMGSELTDEDVKELLEPKQDTDVAEHLRLTISKLAQRVPLEERQRRYHELREFFNSEILSRLHIRTSQYAQIVKWFGEFLSPESIENSNNPMLNFLFFLKHNAEVSAYSKTPEERERRGTWLSSEENYRSTRKYWMEGKLVGVTADIKGPSISLVARWLQDRREKISALYTSNVHHWIGPSETRNMYKVLGGLPLREDTLILMSQGPAVLVLRVRTYNRMRWLYDYVSTNDVEVFNLIEYPQSAGSRQKDSDEFLRQVLFGIDRFFKSERFNKNPGQAAAEFRSYKQLIEKLMISGPAISNLDPEGFVRWVRKDTSGINTDTDYFRAIVFILVDDGYIKPSSDEIKFLPTPAAPKEKEGETKLPVRSLLVNTFTGRLSFLNWAARSLGFMLLSTPAHEFGHSMLARDARTERHIFLGYVKDAEGNAAKYGGILGNLLTASLFGIITAVSICFSGQMNGLHYYALFIITANLFSILSELIGIPFGRGDLSVTKTAPAESESAPATQPAETITPLARTGWLLSRAAIALSIGGLIAYPEILYGYLPIFIQGWLIIALLAGVSKIKDKFILKAGISFLGVVMITGMFQDIAVNGVLPIMAVESACKFAGALLARKIFTKEPLKKTIGTATKWSLGPAVTDQYYYNLVLYPFLQASFSKAHFGVWAPLLMASFDTALATLILHMWLSVAVGTILVENKDIFKEMAKARSVAKKVYPYNFLFWFTALLTGWIILYAFSLDASWLKVMLMPFKIVWIGVISEVMRRKFETEESAPPAGTKTVAGAGRVVRAVLIMVTFGIASLLFNTGTALANKANQQETPAATVEEVMDLSAKVYPGRDVEEKVRAMDAEKLTNTRDRLRKMWEKKLAEEAEKKQDVLIKASDPAVQAQFRKIAGENAVYFSPGVGYDTTTGLVYNHIKVDNGIIVSRMGFFNGTDIGLCLDSLKDSVKGNINIPGVTPVKAAQMIRKTLNTLLKIQRDPRLSHRGLFYWYQFNGENINVDPGHPIASSVDNGKLSLSLAAVAGGLLKEKGCRDIVRMAREIINEQNKPFRNADGRIVNGAWAELYDPVKGLLRAGVDSNSSFLTYWIDRKTNESRSAVAWAILNSGGQVPISAFTNMEAPVWPEPYETLGGKSVSRVLSWKGCKFEFADTSLWIDEGALSSAYREAALEFLTVMIDNNIGREKLPAFKSAAFGPDGTYRTYGTHSLAETEVRFNNQGEVCDGVASPHTIGLARLISPDVAATLMARLIANYPQLNTPFGLLDGIDTNGNVANTICGQNQGMLVIGLQGHENSKDVAAYLQSTGQYNLLKQIYAVQEITGLHSNTTPEDALRLIIAAEKRPHIAIPDKKQSPARHAPAPKPAAGYNLLADYALSSSSENMGGKAIISWHGGVLTVKHNPADGAGHSYAANNLKKPYILGEGEAIEIRGRGSFTLKLEGSTTILRKVDLDGTNGVFTVSDLPAGMSIGIMVIDNVKPGPPVIIKEIRVINTRGSVKTSLFKPAIPGLKIMRAAAGLGIFFAAPALLPAAEVAVRNTPGASLPLFAGLDPAVYVACGVIGFVALLLIGCMSAGMMLDKSRRKESHQAQFNRLGLQEAKKPTAHGTPGLPKSPAGSAKPHEETAGVALKAPVAPPARAPETVSVPPAEASVEHHTAREKTEEELREEGKALINGYFATINGHLAYLEGLRNKCAEKNTGAAWKEYGEEYQGVKMLIDGIREDIKKAYRAISREKSSIEKSIVKFLTEANVKLKNLAPGHVTGAGDQRFGTTGMVPAVWKKVIPVLRNWGLPARVIAAMGGFEEIFFSSIVVGCPGVAGKLIGGAFGHVGIGTYTGLAIGSLLSAWLFRRAHAKGVYHYDAGGELTRGPPSARAITILGVALRLAYFIPALLLPLNVPPLLLWAPFFTAAIHAIYNSILAPGLGLALGIANMRHAINSNEKSVQGKINRVIEKILAIPTIQQHGDEAAKFLNGFADSMPLLHKGEASEERLYEQMLIVYQYYRSAPKEIKFNNPYDEDGRSFGHTDIIFVGENRNNLESEVMKIIKKNCAVESKWAYVYGDTIIIVFEAIKKKGVYGTLNRQGMRAIRRDVENLINVGGERRKIAIEGTASDVHKIIIGAAHKLDLIHSVDVYGSNLAHPWDKPYIAGLKIKNEVRYFISTMLEIIAAFAAAGGPESTEAQILSSLIEPSITLIENRGKRCEICFKSCIDEEIRRYPGKRDELRRLKARVMKEFKKRNNVKKDDVEKEIQLFNRAVEGVVRELDEMIWRFKRGTTGSSKSIASAYEVVKGAFLEYDPASCEKIKSWIRGTDGPANLRGKNAITIVEHQARNYKKCYDKTPAKHHEFKSTMYEMYTMWNMLLNQLHRVRALDGGIDAVSLKDRVRAEQKRLQYAIIQLRSEIRASASRLYLEEFIDDVKRRAPRIIRTGGVTAMSAVEDLAGAAERLITGDKDVSETERESRRSGVRLVVMRLAELIEGDQLGPIEVKGKEDIVLFVEAMDPSRVWQIKRNWGDRVKTIVCPVGSSNSHWVVLARQLGFNVIAAARYRARKRLPMNPYDIETGQPVLVDTARGLVTINPKEETLNSYAERKKMLGSRERFYLSKAKEDACTKDGARLNVLADVGNLDQIPEVISRGAEGVGLYRTEWLYDGARRLTEDEMTKIFVKASEKLAAGKPLTLRLLDMREDKLPSTLAPSSYGGCDYYFSDQEGTRVAIEELRAMMKAYAKSRKKNIEILFPMVSSDDIPMIKKIVEGQKRMLINEGIPVEALNGIKIGGMIETPEAARDAERLFEYFDFIKVGMNDFYTESKPGTDRESDKDDEYFTTLNPVILGRLVHVAKAARIARKSLGFCGMWASSPRFALFLLRLTRIYPDISITSEIEELPRLKAIIRRSTVRECLQLFRPVRSIADAKTPVSSSDLLDKMARKKEKQVEARILQSAEYRRWKVEGAEAKLQAGAWTGLAERFGIRNYSPFIHAPFLEELAKVCLPLYIAGSVSWAVLGIAAFVFVALHIFNEPLPFAPRNIDPKEAAGGLVAERPVRIMASSGEVFDFRYQKVPKEGKAAFTLTAHDSAGRAVGFIDVVRDAYGQNAVYGPFSHDLHSGLKSDYGLYVRDEYRNGGIATGLLILAMAIAQSRGNDTFILGCPNIDQNISMEILVNKLSGQGVIFYKSSMGKYCVSLVGIRDKLPIALPYVVIGDKDKKFIERPWVILSWFARVFTAPLVAASAGIAIPVFGPSLFDKLGLVYMSGFSSNASGATILAMLVHLGINALAALVNKTSGAKSGYAAWAGKFYGRSGSPSDDPLSVRIKQYVKGEPFDELAQYIAHKTAPANKFAGAIRRFTSRFSSRITPDEKAHLERFASMLYIMGRNGAGLSEIFRSGISADTRAALQQNRRILALIDNYNDIVKEMVKVPAGPLEPAWSMEHVADIFARLHDEGSTGAAEKKYIRKMRKELGEFLIASPSFNSYLGNLKSRLMEAVMEERGWGKAVACFEDLIRSDTARHCLNDLDLLLAAKSDKYIMPYDIETIVKLVMIGLADRDGMIICHTAEAALNAILEEAYNPKYSNSKKRDLILNTVRNTKVMIDGREETVLSLVTRNAVEGNVLIRAEALETLKLLGEPGPKGGTGPEPLGPSGFGSGAGISAKSLLPIFIALTLFVSMGAKGDVPIWELLWNIAKSYPGPMLLFIAAVLFILASLIKEPDATINKAKTAKPADVSKPPEVPSSEPAVAYEPGTLNDKSGRISVMVFIFGVLLMAGSWICVKYGYTGAAGLLTPLAMSGPHMAIPVVFAIIFSAIGFSSGGFVSFLSLAASSAAKIFLCTAVKNNYYHNILAMMPGSIFNYSDMAAYAIGAIVIYLAYPDKRSIRGAFIFPLLIIAAILAGFEIMRPGSPVPAWHGFSWETIKSSPLQNLVPKGFSAAMLTGFAFIGMAAQFNGIGKKRPASSPDSPDGDPHRRLRRDYIIYGAVFHALSFAAFGYLSVLLVSSSSTVLLRSIAAPGVLYFLAQFASTMSFVAYGIGLLPPMEKFFISTHEKMRRWFVSEPLAWTVQYIISPFWVLPYMVISFGKRAGAIEAAADNERRISELEAEEVVEREFPGESVPVKETLKRFLTAYKMLVRGHSTINKVKFIYAGNKESPGNIKRVIDAVTQSLARESGIIMDQPEIERAIELSKAALALEYITKGSPVLIKANKSFSDKAEKLIIRAHKALGVISILLIFSHAFLANITITSIGFLGLAFAIGGFAAIMAVRFAPDGLIRKKGLELLSASDIPDLYRRAIIDKVIAMLADGRLPRKSYEDSVINSLSRVAKTDSDTESIRQYLDTRLMTEGNIFTRRRLEEYVTLTVNVGPKPLGPSGLGFGAGPKPLGPSGLGFGAGPKPLGPSGLGLRPEPDGSGSGAGPEPLGPSDLGFGAGMIPALRWIFQRTQNTRLKYLGMTERGQAVWEQAVFTAITNLLSWTGWYGGTIGAIFISWSVFYASHLGSVGGVRAPPASAIFRVYLLNVLSLSAITPFGGITGLVLNILQFAVVSAIHYRWNIGYLASTTKEPPAELKVPADLKRDIMISFASVSMFFGILGIINLGGFVSIGMLIGGIAVMVFYILKRESDEERDLVNKRMELMIPHELVGRMHSMLHDYYSKIAPVGGNSFLQPVILVDKECKDRVIKRLRFDLDIYDEMERHINSTWRSPRAVREAALLPVEARHKKWRETIIAQLGLKYEARERRGLSITGIYDVAGDVDEEYIRMIGDLALDYRVNPILVTTDEKVADRLIRNMRASGVVKFDLRVGSPEPVENYEAPNMLEMLSPAIRGKLGRLLSERFRPDHWHPAAGVIFVDDADVEPVMKALEEELKYRVPFNVIRGNLLYSSDDRTKAGKEKRRRYYRELQDELGVNGDFHFEPVALIITRGMDEGYAAMLMGSDANKEFAPVLIVPSGARAAKGFEKLGSSNRVDFTFYMDLRSEKSRQKDPLPENSIAAHAVKAWEEPFACAGFAGGLPFGSSAAAVPHLAPEYRYIGGAAGFFASAPFLIAQQGTLGLALAVIIPVIMFLPGWGFHELGHIINRDSARNSSDEMYGGPLASAILFAITSAAAIFFAFSPVQVPVIFTKVPLAAILTSAAASYFVHIFADENALIIKLRSSGLVKRADNFYKRGAAEFSNGNYIGAMLLFDKSICGYTRIVEKFSFVPTGCKGNILSMFRMMKSIIRSIEINEPGDGEKSQYRDIWRGCDHRMTNCLKLIDSHSKISAPAREISILEFLADDEDGSVQLAPRYIFGGIVLGIAVAAPLLFLELGWWPLALDLAVITSIASFTVGWVAHELGHWIGGDFGRTNVKEMRAGPAASLALFVITSAAAIISFLSHARISLIYLDVPLYSLFASAAANYLVHIFADGGALFSARGKVSPEGLLEEAIGHYDGGVKAFNEDDYLGAMMAFDKAILIYSEALKRFSIVPPGCERILRNMLRKMEEIEKFISGRKWDEQIYEPYLKRWIHCHNHLIHYLDMVATSGKVNVSNDNTSRRGLGDDGYFTPRGVILLPAVLALVAAVKEAGFKFPSFNVDISQVPAGYIVTYAVAGAIILYFAVKILREAYKIIVTALKIAVGLALVYGILAYAVPYITAHWPQITASFGGLMEWLNSLKKTGAAALWLAPAGLGAAILGSIIDMRSFMNGEEAGPAPRKLLIGTTSEKIYDELKPRVGSAGFPQDIVADVVLLKDTVSAAKELSARAREQNLTGVLVDDTISIENTRTEQFKQDLAEVKLTRDYDIVFRATTIDNSVRDRIDDVIKALLPRLGKVDFDKAIREYQKKHAAKGFSLEEAERLATLRRLVTERRVDERVKDAYYTPVPAIDRSSLAKPVVIVTSEDTALSDPYTVENMDEAAKQGIVSYIVGGDDIKNAEDMLLFLRAGGYAGDGSMARFVNKHDYASYSAMMDAIAGQTGTSREFIGVRAAKGELMKDGEKPGAEKFLEIEEIEVNNTRVLAAIHSYSVLVNLVVDGAGKLPPGVTDERQVSGKFRFNPILPIGIDKEIATYRHAMLLLSSAA